MQFASRRAEYAALEHRIIASVKDELEKGNYDFTGFSFYSLSSSEMNDYFINRTFYMDVDFSYTHFHGIHFENCVFKAKAIFRNAVFENYYQRFMFTNCTFEGPADFRATRFVCGGGGFKAVRFSNGADFSNADFQYGVLSYEIQFGKYWTINDVGTLFDDVESSHSVLFDNAKGVWGIIGNSGKILDLVADATFREMPTAVGGGDYNDLKDALEAVETAIQGREGTCADEAREHHRQRFARINAKFPLRRFDTFPALCQKLTEFFGNSEFRFYRLKFRAPRVLSLMGIGKEWFIEIYIMHEREGPFYAFGHLDF
jgi:hypothetical protein